MRTFLPAPSTRARRRLGLLACLAASTVALAPSFAVAAVATFQEGVSSYVGTQDTELRSASAGVQRGNSDPISIDTGGSLGTQQGLIRFDNIFGAGPGQIPPGSLINSATLRVNVVGNSLWGAQITLHRMLVTWSEASTWNSMVNGIQFDGTDARATIDAMIPNPIGFGYQTWSGANLTATVQAWSNGTATNYGWGITLASGDNWDFSSSETATAASRPLLTIDYTPTYTISGTVFEDVNYGGGAGRSRVAAGGVVRSGARVELFNAAGNYVTSTLTDGSGNYSFTALAAATYTVRVVNGTVTSSRTGYIAGVLPVQTYRTSASTGTAVAVTDRVGGQDPTRVDAGNGSTTLGALTTLTTTAQSITTVTIGAASVSGVDFGFNFDTIVNRNNTGQGSLRQFLANANALGGEASLAQSGSRMNLGASQALPAGIESSIFMVSDGAAHPGLRAGLANQLTAGVAAIATATALPAITGAGTSVDGTTQTFNVGDTNPGTQGAGGSVGVDALALPAVPKPEVQIADGAAIVAGLDVQANNVTIRGCAVYGFGTSADTPGHAGIVVRNNFTGAVIEQNFLGSTAASFAAPGDLSRANVRSEGADNGTVRNNLIGYSSSAGFFGAAATTGWTIQANEIRENPGSGYLPGNGIDLGSAGSGSCTIQGNRILLHSGSGLETAGGAGANNLVNNTITQNGGAGGYTSGVRIAGNGNTVDRNVIQDNQGAGVLVAAAATGNRITRNSIRTNGTSSGQIGIDLLLAADNPDLGTAPFVTLNDNGDADGGANGALNYPVITTALAAGSTLSVRGFARPGSVLEFFAVHPDPSGFGEGKTYLFSGTEGGGGDTDGGTGSYGPAAVNGILQGSDNTNRFAFTVALPPGISADSLLTATATDVANNTSEFGGVVTVRSLAVVKRAFLLDGTPLASGVIAPKGARVRFLIYVSNRGGAVNDVSIQDVLDPGFAYLPGTIRVDNSVPACSGDNCTGPEEAAIYAAVAAQAPMTDTVDADAASYSGGSSRVDAGDVNVGNGQLDLAANRVWAMLVTVRVR